MNFEELIKKNESQVRSYSRHFPTVFSTAKGACIYDENGNRYIDFLAGAGALNYGHNNDYLKSSLVDYINSDNIMHALDMFTVAKAEFIDTFYSKIINPKNLDYKIMFCGSTGTNAVEAALKLARKNTHRRNVVAFHGAFHGMTLGSLAVTTDKTSRGGAGVDLNNVLFIPYFDGGNYKIDGLDYLEEMLLDDHSGIEKPAAVIVETVQAEGGIYVASIEWLQRLEKICKDNGVLLICDDIQIGCSRTGTFFSFERAGIHPDMVTLSKSISGYGLPMSILLIRDELDIWKPAEHNGTFRGNQLAFVAAKKAIEFNIDNNLDGEVLRKAQIVEKYIADNICRLNDEIKYRGIGLIWGIDLSCYGSEFAEKVADTCFSKGLIIERAGRRDDVLKILPPLIIEDELLIKGMDIIKESIVENSKK